MKKIALFVMALTMMLLPIPSLYVQAAEKISLTDGLAVNIEYEETSEVTAGTIRYVSQNQSSGLFKSSYWGPYAHLSGHECFSASISMSLSSIGLNYTVAALGDWWARMYPHATDVFNTVSGDIVGNSYECDHPDFYEAMRRYNENSGYSVPIIKLDKYSWSHFVVVIGKNENGDYLILDPAADHVWTMTIEKMNDGTYQLGYVHPKTGKNISERHQIFATQYYNSDAAGCFSVVVLPEGVTALNATATVTYSKAVLRADAGQAYKVIRKVKVGEKLTIVGYKINTHSNRWLLTSEGAWIYDQRCKVTYDSEVKGTGLNLLTGDHTYGRIYCIDGSVKTGNNGGLLRCTILQDGNEVLSSQVELAPNTTFSLRGSQIDKELVYNHLSRNIYETKLQFIETIDTGVSCQTIKTLLFHNTFTIR